MESKQVRVLEVLSHALKLYLAKVDRTLMGNSRCGRGGGG